jgi:DNA-binding NarL/FixJ family response regulator
MSTRILIADDHAMIRSGLRSVLEAHSGWEVVAEAADGREAVAQALQTRPNVAVVDYLLPALNGIEVTRQIRGKLPETEVLIFSLHEEDSIISEVLEAGARAYVLKSEANDYLVSAVAALAEHRPFFSGRISERLMRGFVSKNRGESIDGLTPRERLIVQMIAEGQTNQSIARTLNLSVKTIESHRAAAMAKIGATSTVAIARYAIKNKLVEL